jgi:hypothetical protein
MSAASQVFVMVQPIPEPSEGAAKALQISILQALRSSFSLAMRAMSSDLAADACACSARGRSGAIAEATEKGPYAQRAKYDDRLAITALHILELKSYRHSGETTPPKE